MPENTVEIDPNFEIYDHEILDAEKVIEKLNQRAGGTGEQRKLIDVENFRRETIERFHEAGLVVDVVVHETNIEKLYWWTIVIKGRVDTKHAFDPDRMQHEVVNDILETGVKGTIGMDGRLKE